MKTTLQNIGVSGPGREEHFWQNL